MKIFNVGDRVEILRTDITPLKHRKRPLFGFVEGVDGSYIYVRPAHCTWVSEMYPDEIRKA
jgi:hypothetical protein